jgi:3-isopropylmalate/(R)-2-methylmalate dehydratase large subunit
MGESLFDKVWDLHTVRELPSGQSQLLIGLHLIHEVTSPQGFQMLEAAGLEVLHPERTVATVDHIVPTDSQARPFADTLAERMLAALERNCRKHGIRLFDVGSGRQGIVHVIGPQLGLTQPGQTIACGDSHTSTHGAFGAIALGIGTSQVRDVLASQCLALARPGVRRIEVSGKLGRGVYAKDVILHVIRSLGVKGGIGYAYEYAGEVIEALSMEERMTLCNMSIEGGARVGYVNPDSTTFDYLRGREFAPQGEAFERAVEWWRSMASDADADYDDRVALDGGSMSTRRCPAWRTCPRTSAPWPRRRSRTWICAPATPSRARRSTWRSSAPARTAGSRTCARPPAWRKVDAWRPASARSSFRAPRR